MRNELGQYVKNVPFISLVCKGCGEQKIASEFPAHRRKCRDCVRIRTREDVVKRRADSAYAEKLRRKDSERRMRKSDRMRHLFNAAKSGAIRRGLPFILIQSDVTDKLDNQSWKCAKTGIPFDLTYGKGKRPFSPSIDRIDNSRGYEPGNIQIVCSIYNFAKNVFTDDDVFRLAEALVNART